MRILVLSELLPANLKENVIFRKAKDSEFLILLQYLKEFQKEALNREMNEEILFK